MRGQDFYKLVTGYDEDVKATIRDMLGAWGDRSTLLSMRGASLDQQVAVIVHAAIGFSALQVFAASDDKRQWEWYRAFDNGTVAAFFLSEIDRHRAAWAQGDLMPPVAPFPPPRIIR